MAMNSNVYPAQIGGYLNKSISLLLLFIILCLIGGTSRGIENRQVISSEIILKKINNLEPVNYKYSIIEGDLNLDNINDSIMKSIESPIIIVDCEIKGNVLFNKSIFNKPVNFEKTKFYGTSCFEGTQFQDYANFNQCKFFRYTTFREAKFRESASFWRSSFFNFSTFRNSKFDGSRADFHRCEFRDNVSFNFANFNVDETNFENSIFNYAVNFQKVRFNGKALFLGSKFKNEADFSESQFNSSSDFLGARFEKELYFNNVKFDKLNVNWDSIRYKLVDDEPGYILLINNFKRMGQFNDADSCYYEYREWKRNNRPAYEWTEQIWDLLAWISCGYGVRWTHTIITGGFIILLFGIYYWIYDYHTILGGLLSGEDSVGNAYVELFFGFRKAMLLSVMCLLSLPGEMYPYGRKNYSILLKSHLFTVILERLLGWGLMLLLIGTISRLIVRY
jgi:uncharacterized protein YjbI with pentapeptide repeats